MRKGSDQRAGAMCPTCCFVSVARVGVPTRSQIEKFREVGLLSWPVFRHSLSSIERYQCVRMSRAALGTTMECPHHTRQGRVFSAFGSYRQSVFRQRLR